MLFDRTLMLLWCFPTLLFNGSSIKNCSFYYTRRRSSSNRSRSISLMVSFMINHQSPQRNSVYALQSLTKTSFIILSISKLRLPYKRRAYKTLFDSWVNYRKSYREILKQLKITDISWCLLLLVIVYSGNGQLCNS